MSNWFKDKERLLASTLLAGAAIFTAVPQANAQQPPVETVPPAEEAEEEGGDREAIVVTGSRLRRDTFQSPNPTVSVGAQELEARQLSNIGDAIEDIPLIGIGGNSRDQAGVARQNGDSFALPDVLDLGTQRTLTLVNGRRIQPTLPGTVFVPGNSSGSQVDLSLFGPAIVERVEIVAGTGGAIYGADAVGGVVNIITRTDFEGASVSAQAGVTGLGDGEQFRVSGIWGKNFFGDRLNLILTGDVFNQELIATSAERASRYFGSGINNPLQGSRRDPNPFTAASAADTLRAGGTLAAPFLPGTTDGIASVFFGPLNLASTLTTPGGVLLTRHQLTGVASNTQIVPTGFVAPTLAGQAADPQGFAFFAPTALPAGVTALSVINTLAPGTNLTGLSAAQQSALALQLLQRNRPTPYEYYLRNPSLNQNLFLGTFGNPTNIANGFFPTIANTDPATRNLFPRVAVPLQFDASGNLVAFNPGSFVPPNLGQLSAAYGGQGYDATAVGHNQFQAGTERMSFGGLANFELTDNIRLKSEVFYSDITFKQLDGGVTNTPAGGASGGNFAIPIFLDQNPFVTSATQSTIAGLVGQGLAVPTLGGQRVLYAGRSVTDILGPDGWEAEIENTTFRVMQAIEGDFTLFDREFYFEVAGIYGRSEINNTRRDLLDLEFALAADVVTGPNGQPVCRQQTLAAPERVDLRNPGLANIVIAGSLPSALVPTAAQVAACVPLNVMGAGRASAAARNYVTAETTGHSLNSLTVVSGSLGGDIYELPAGWIQAGLQVEGRTEAAEFEPDRAIQLGKTRTALQVVGGGERDFDEYGIEINVPILGDGFSFPLAREFEVTYAWRQVEREQTTPFAAVQGSGTNDDTFNYSFRYKPVDDLTLRGARSRTVRSASLVELFDPGIRAFGGLAGTSHPCSTINIDSGPNPSVRRANCVSAVQTLGIRPDAASATTFLAGFNPTTAPNRPATAAGNPFLANEEANTYTIGFTYEPEWLPRFLFAADFFSVDLSGELSLVGTPVTSNACFDSPSFPNSIVGAANPACDAILFNGTDAAGNFIVPTVNALTGRQTILTRSFGGQPASVQAPFEFAALDFLNLNLASREIRAVNVETRYNFPLGDLPYVGEMLADFGDVYLANTVFHTQRYDQFTPTKNPIAKEHGNPEYKVRTEIRHVIGDFDHTLQWFWNSETVTDITVAKGLYPEQSPAFRAEAYHYFNYLASYAINDRFTARLVVNNLMDTEDPRGEFGLGNDFDGGLGREFIVGVSARF